MSKARVLHCAGLFCGLSFVSVVGCNRPVSLNNKAEREPYGYVFYLDGAGGGRALRNYSGGVREGLLSAGYRGAGEVFQWNTGLGVTADQSASNDYKRRKAGELADKIRAYKARYPKAPVDLIGLSAGTALTVFTLEALTADTPVDNVVLLGASISANHDLTQALQNVRDKMYVFTSEKDAVLRFLVPIGGTADRTTSRSAGLNGFRMPAGATAQTRDQYRKLVQVPWREEFARKGNYGGHTDTVNGRFVQSYVAPLLMKQSSRTVELAAAHHHVHNPDFERWARFKPGSWVKMEGHQVTQRVRHPLRVTERLVSRQKDQLVVERTYEFLATGKRSTRQFFVMAAIIPEEHPFTHAGVQVTDLPRESVSVGIRTLNCDVKKIESVGDYPEWGRDPRGTVYINREIPGGLAHLELAAHADSGAYAFNGSVVEYEVMH